MPETGSSADSWGGKLNSDFSDLDALLSAITTTGSANAYVLTSGLSLAAYVSGQSFLIKANFTNSGAATINVDTLGAKSLVKGVSTALASGDITSGAIYHISYDGTNFNVLNAGGLYQASDATLTALAALSYTSGTLNVQMTGPDTFALASDALNAKLAGANVFTSNTPNNFQTNGGGVTISNTAGSALSWSIQPQISGVTSDGFGIVQGSTVVFSASSAFAVNIPVGPLTVASVPVCVAGKTAIPIPASAMIGNTTNGAASGTTETSTNKVMLRTLDFDTTTQEGAQFSVPMPKSWNESTVTFEPIWTASAGTAADTVVWELRAVALSNDDALDTAWGTGQTSSDALIATNDVHIGPESSAITIGGTPAEGDLVFFQIRRVPASDNLPNDAKLIGIRLYITTNAANDA